MALTTLRGQKSKRTVKSFFPILEWLPAYKPSFLRPDLIAALTVWALLVPEAMAYAGIAGMPPETGLYAAPLALIAYAIFGTSKHLNVGPSSTVAALSLSVVVGFAAVGTDEFIALTVMLALLTGILLIIAGLLRLGVLADFLRARCWMVLWLELPLLSSSVNWISYWVSTPIARILCRRYWPLLSI